ncbi:hypothetical protein [Nostoc sp.]|uniref:hypothetical protein n=1 Tax=Nostoc sp. TaxID=1180 RepID=UPI002FFA8316
MNPTPNSSSQAAKRFNHDAQRFKFQYLRVKLELSNVWVVEDFSVGWLCDAYGGKLRLLPNQSGVVLGFWLRKAMRL